MKTEFEILEEKCKLALETFDFFYKLHDKAFDEWEREYKEYYDRIFGGLQATGF